MRLKTRDVVFYSVWLIALFLIPEIALAWGPGAHIECSLYLLRHLVMIAPLVRKLITNHSSEFMYGAISPDMILGKRYIKPENSNHNWSFGYSLHEQAKTPAQKSFALGYLSHLAADTVAHNLFIPDQLLGLNKFDVRGEGHVTYELLFDMSLENEVWTTARALSKRPMAHCNRLLSHNLQETLLPIKVNNAIFNSGVWLVRLGWWQRIINRMRGVFDYRLQQFDFTPYLQAMHQTVVSFLNDPDSAECRGQCPSGGFVLPEAENLRRTLKKLSREEILDSEWYFSIVSGFEKWRETSIVLQNAARAVVTLLE